MMIPSRLYDILKWVNLVLLPALATAYVGLASIFNWPYSDEVAKATAVVCTLIGTLLGISTAEYNRLDQEKV